MIEPSEEIQVIELHVLMATVAKMSRHAFEQRLSVASADISPLQYGVLRTLNYEGSFTISELSRRFHCDPSTLVPSVDKLEARGLVQRQRDPNDRRRIPLLLTEAGQTMLNLIPIVCEEDPLMIGLRHMPAEDVTHLLALMRSLVRHMPEGEALLEHAMERLRAYHVVAQEQRDQPVSPRIDPETGVE